MQICLDVTDGGAKFWLESVEVADIIKAERDVLMDEQLKGVGDVYVVAEI